METITFGKTTIENEIKDNSLTLKFSGISDLGNQETLNKAFLSLFEQILKEKDKHELEKIVFNFVNLKFVNSCTIRNFISLFKLLITDIVIDVVYDIKSTWQDITFETIDIMIKGISENKINLIKYDPEKKWIDINKNCPVCKWNSMQQLVDKKNDIWAERCKHGCIENKF